MFGIIPTMCSQLQQLFVAESLCHITRVNNKKTHTRNLGMIFEPNFFFIYIVIGQGIRIKSRTVEFVHGETDKENKTI